MHLDRRQAVQYLKDVGFPMAERTYYRFRNELNNQKQERLYKIARYGYEEEHTDAIEEIEIARKLMWKEYAECKGAVSRTIILEKIINTRPLLSSYYDSTRGVIEKQNGHKDQEDRNNISGSSEGKPRLIESQSWAVQE